MAGADVGMHKPAEGGERRELVSSATNSKCAAMVMVADVANAGGDKFFLYRQIPSFREYVLIEQKKHLVDIHYKNENSDLWRITRYEGLGTNIPLQSLGIELTMEELYDRVVFPIV